MHSADGGGIVRLGNCGNYRGDGSMDDLEGISVAQAIGCARGEETDVWILYLFAGRANSDDG